MQAQENKAPAVFRHEVKYYLCPSEAFLLAQYLRRVMHVDRHAGPGGLYWVRSLYFDTYGNRDYYDKVNGYSERSKLRLRIYDTDGGTAALELKSKRGAFVHKKSVRLDEKDALRLIADDHAFLAGMQNDAADKLYACFCLERLRPVVLIEYTREAFELPFENIRVTIDRDLRASMDAGRLFDKNVPCVSVLDGARCILEVKYRCAIPDFLRSILSGIGSPNASISKYAMSRQIIHF